MAGINIIAVESKSELKDFVDLPWKIYAAYPKWVPSLKKDVRHLLDPARHPVWESAERALFLARRGSETVGRIAGVIDRAYNRFHGEEMGIWGFFECADDQEAATALFSAAEMWVRRKGMAFIRGPLSPNTNYEIGLLIEGFEYPPVVEMPYQPPYYLKLVEASGFAKEKDLLAFLIEGDYHLPAWMDDLAGRIAQKKGIHIKLINRKDVSAEFALIREIYNDSWSGNWGFVPLSGPEMREIEKNVMQFMDPDLAFFIYFENDPAAVCVIFPDMNPLLKRLNGRIGVTGVWKALRYRRKIDGLRLIMLGIKDKYRQMGIPLLAFHHICEVVRQKKKYRYMELGWTLEDNEAINTLIEEVGGKPYKRYRIFRKSFELKQMNGQR